MAATAKPKTTISIWFFIGISLLVNGIIIFGAGVYELVNPRPLELRVVLYQFHAGIWWGALLAALGGIYCYYFLPSRSRE